jgi:alpha-tubulin suppressor-like RCC1 family protein
MNDDVWICGFNGNGQLGLGDNINRNVFTQILNLKAKQVSAGNKHTAAIDLNNDVWSFGSNENGQLGLGDNKDRNESTQIPNLKAKKISVGG